MKNLPHTKVNHIAPVVNYCKKEKYYFNSNLKVSLYLPGVLSGYAFASQIKKACTNQKPSPTQIFQLWSNHFLPFSLLS